MLYRNLLLLFIISILGLTACGGGGGQSSATPAKPQTKTSSRLNVTESIVGAVKGDGSENNAYYILPGTESLVFSYKYENVGTADAYFQVVNFADFKTTKDTCFRMLRQGLSCEIELTPNNVSLGDHTYTEPEIIYNDVGGGDPTVTSSTTKHNSQKFHVKADWNAEGYSNLVADFTESNNFITGLGTNDNPLIVNNESNNVTLTITYTNKGQADAIVTNALFESTNYTLDANKNKCLTTLHQNESCNIAFNLKPNIESVGSRNFVMPTINFFDGKNPESQQIQFKLNTTESTIYVKAITKSNLELTKVEPKGFEIGGDIDLGFTALPDKKQIITLTYQNNSNGKMTINGFTDGNLNNYESRDDNCINKPLNKNEICTISYELTNKDEGLHNFKYPLVQYRDEIIDNITYKYYKDDVKVSVKYPISLSVMIESMNFDSGNGRVESPLFVTPTNLQKIPIIKLMVKNTGYKKVIIKDSSIKRLNANTIGNVTINNQCLVNTTLAINDICIITFEYNDPTLRFAIDNSYYIQYEATDGSTQFVTAASDSLYSFINDSLTKNTYLFVIDKISGVPNYVTGSGTENDPFIIQETSPFRSIELLIRDYGNNKLSRMYKATYETPEDIIDSLGNCGLAPGTNNDTYNCDLSIKNGIPVGLYDIPLPTFKIGYRKPDIHQEISELYAKPYPYLYGAESKIYVKIQ